MPPMVRNEVIKKCERFCADHEISEWAFGKDAVGDHKFLSRLRTGKGVTLTIIERAEAFMRDAERQTTDLNNSHPATIGTAAE